MKIAIVPLDTRACNLKFPQELVNIAGVEVYTVPEQYLGCFLKGGDSDSISDWLEAIASEVDAIVLSIDMLCYGGLIKSRIVEKSTEQCFSILKILKKIKKINSKITIYAFNIIMRTSISTVSPETVKYWEYINKYSYLWGLNTVQGNPEIAEQLKKVRELIPSDILESFLKSRDRNHLVNMKCIELVNEDMLDYILLLQEDSNIFGVQKIEQQKLNILIEQYDLKGRAQIQNGADEGCMTLIARYINHTKGYVPKIFIYPSAPGLNEFIPLYEDRVFQENIDSHIRTVGGVRTNNIESCDFVLAIYYNQSGQSDICMETIRPSAEKDSYKNFINYIRDSIENGHRVGILDINFANGADAQLVKQMLDTIPIWKISGYSGWNTASNSLGTLLAQMSMHTLPKKEVSLEQSDQANYKFFLERIIDDCVYQSDIRQIVSDKLKEDGINIWNLENHKENVQIQIEKLINQRIEKVLGSYVNSQIENLSITLPWARVFEIDVQVTLKI